ncbi:MAG TPA: heme-binding protein [Candidatus Solibacter sp.]|nr:heme-binding protein [Candidatus Solibacter sp.]
MNIVTAAAVSVNDETMIIAVTDRQGNVLALYRKPMAPVTTSLGANYTATVNANDLAISLAHTAGFFSNDQAPLSSRTVRFISGIHFPPGVMNQPNADLYGIENTNRGCTLVPPANFIAGQGLPPSTALAGGPGLGITTGKADLMDSQPFAVNPGGVPIFKANAAGNVFAVGGVGVVASNLDVAEFAAFSGAFSAGFGVGPLPAPGVVIVGGIALPFVNNTTIPAGSGFVAGTNDGAFVALAATTFVPATNTTRGSSGMVPEGDLITPAAAAGLTAAQVAGILDASEAAANQTRGVIRLPLGSRAHMVIAVSDLNGNIIGLRRMRDATIFSVDVAASKARNMIYFNSAARVPADMSPLPVGTAVTNRTISFGAMPLYPPGIDGTTPGPFFNLFLNDTANPCSQGSQPANANQSGIVFFPGSVGLYVNGALVGGLGISGDGVDQDDFVTNSGASGFLNFTPTCTGATCYLPALGIRADQQIVNSVRLPFSKFPRNPTN